MIAMVRSPVRGLRRVAAPGCAALALLTGCTHLPTASRVPPQAPCAPCPAALWPEPSDHPREIVGQFLGAVVRGDFDAAWRLLASPWRERYTPSRLSFDFSAVRGLAQDKLARIRASPDSGWRIGADQAVLPIAQGKAVRLVRESEGWRIAALE